MSNAWIYLIIYTSWWITGEGAGHYELVKDLCQWELKTKSGLIGFKVYKNINWQPKKCFQSRDSFNILIFDEAHLYINFISANDAMYVLKNNSVP